MPSFHYANPAAIHWGPGCVRDRLRDELRRLGARRVLLVTTRSAVADPGLAPVVEGSLGELLAGRFSAVGQHTPVSAVAAGVEAAAATRADALVSLGGGSPIDCAKAVAFSLATGLDLRRPEALAAAPRATVRTALPHVAVPTTLSAAELSEGAGFSAEGTRAKVGVRAPPLLPAAVLYDAELALRTPLPLWLSTGIRAVDHAAETLLAPGDHPLPDVAAVDALRRLARGLRAARAHPDDPAARTECQLGAWFSDLHPSASSRGLSHTLSKRLGSRHGIPHGVSSCLTLPHVLRYLAPRAPRAMALVAAGLGAPDAAGAADAVTELIADLDLPRHLAEWHLTEAELRDAAQDVATPDHPQGDLLAILHAAL